MSASEVVLVRAGGANLASVAAAFARAGASTRVTESAADVREAHFVVLPGVGAFGHGMRCLQETGLEDAVKERVRTDRPLLAICLGLQVLCESSEETPGVEGLSVIPSEVRRFGGGVHVPQMGWNSMRVETGAKTLQNADVYFANSYRIQRAPDGWIAAKSDHGGEFVAGLERGNIVACQFHPELSGLGGLQLIQRWMEVARSC